MVGYEERGAEIGIQNNERKFNNILVLGFSIITFLLITLTFFFVYEIERMQVKNDIKPEIKLKNSQTEILINKLPYQSPKY